LDIAITRRGLLKSVMAVGSVATLGSFSAISTKDAVAATDRFAFAAIDANRHGYIVVIDPGSPDAAPKKRSALGRFKHENAEVVVNKAGRIVGYMGDDERGDRLSEFL